MHELQDFLDEHAPEEWSALSEHRRMRLATELLGAMRLGFGTAELCDPATRAAVLAMCSQQLRKV